MGCSQNLDTAISKMKALSPEFRVRVMRGGSLTVAPPRLFVFVDG